MMTKFKRIICALLAVSLSFLCSCSKPIDKEPEKQESQIKYNTPAGLAKKTETVYVNLDTHGNATQTIVSDWIHTTQSQVFVDDVTNLTQIENIKDDSVPDHSGQALRWYMDKTDIYYQGKSEAPLPLSFEISYSLNGVPMTADEIAGKSGSVEITVKMKNNDAHVVRVYGKDVTMYSPMVVIGGVTMNENNFQNISVTNGKSVGNGNNQIALLVGFPGINDSLGLTDLPQNPDSEMQYSFDDTFVISADVDKFELGNIMFAAIPIASLDIGLNSISTSMDDVRANLSKLQSVQQSLQNINADQLLNTLTSNPNKLSELSDLVSHAATLYDDNKALIEVIKKFATPQNMQTIQLLTEYISTADFDGLEGALDVINSIFGDEQSAAKIQEGLDLLREMSNDLSDPEVQKAIDNLPQTVATLNALQKALDENRDVIEALQILAESDVLTSIESALVGVEGSIAAGSISQFANITGDADEVTAKMTAWIELGKRYTIFTKKTENMTSSVMFVFKVDSIKSSIINDEDESVIPEVEESSGLKGIFKKIFG